MAIKIDRTLTNYVVALGMVMPFAAQAQDSKQARPADKEFDGEIIVTAQRRSERLQDVPITVTVFDNQQIESKRIQALSDVVGFTPGLSFDAFPSGQPRPFIRGIGSADRGAGGDPSSAVFLDEIYLGRPAAVAFDAFDIQQIEVLKGPQGTLFGRNVVGGAVVVTTKRPTIGEFDASAELTAGNYDRLEGAGFLNVPLGSQAALRASGSVRTHDGYVHNNFTGNELDDQETMSGRLQLLVEPADNFRVHLSADVTRDRANGPAQFAFDLDPTSSRRTLWRVNRDRDTGNASEIDGFQNRDTWGFRGEVQWDLGAMKLTYLGSFRDLDYGTFYDFDGGNPTFNRAGLFASNSESSSFWSNEIRLSSSSSSPITWVLGAYQFGQEVDRIDDAGIYTRANLTAAVPNPVPNDRFRQRSRLSSYAVFADATVPVTEGIRVFGGLRYSKDKKDFSISNQESTALFRATERYSISADASFDAITWRAGVDFRMAPNHLLYGTVSRGFKSGGFQDTPATAASALTAFNPEYATQYEVGLKSQFFGRRVTWNNTIYQVDYTDLQTRRAVGLSIITSNAGKARIRGYETSLDVRPFGGLRLGFSYAYTDAKFLEFLDAGVNFSGNRISRTPKHKLSVSPSYRLDFADNSSIELGADYQYESTILDDNDNNAIEVRAPSEVIDARLIFTDSSRRWSASIWGKNLTNEVRRTFQAQFFGANFGGYAPPRTYGATIRWKY